MTKKSHDSYCLFKKQMSAGKIWYVKFWDNKTCRYNLFKSTGIPVEGKRERRKEAEETAKKMLDSLYEAFICNKYQRLTLLKR